MCKESNPCLFVTVAGYCLTPQTAGVCISWAVQSKQCVMCDHDNMHYMHYMHYIHYMITCNRRR